MKRLLPLIILALLAPGVAEAQRGDRGERREARAERGWSDRGPPRTQQPRARQGRQQERWRERGPRPGRPDRRFVDRDGRFEVARARRDRGRRPDRGPPPGQQRRLRDGKPLPPGQARRLERRGGFARGHILPPELRRARMQDYARHRLRRPPAGYSYYLRGRSAYLVSDRTGMIFEVVPLER